MMLDMREADLMTKEIIARMETFFSNAESSGLWNRVRDWMASAVNRLYALRGGAYGRPDWPSLSDSGRPRMGSNGGVFGVYSGDALPLYASGDYAASFADLFSTPKNLRWGSNHRLAEKIPYGGWRTGQAPRYAMPDNLSDDFVRELNGINNDWIHEGIEQALAGVGL